MRILNAFYIAFAIALLAAGLLVLPLPVPLGVPLISVSIIILIRESKLAKMLIYHARLRSKRVNTFLYWIEKRTPSFAANTLKRTRPQRNQATGKLFSA